MYDTNDALARIGVGALILALLAYTLAAPIGL